MTSQIIRKFNRRIHLLNLISPYLPSDEFITLSLLSELDSACERFLAQMRGIYE